MRNTKKIPENSLDIGSIVIPAPVLFDPDLTARERILYGIISHLTERSLDGYTYASNVDLAKALGFDPQIASNAIAKLRQRGFIVVEYGSPTGEGGFKYEAYEDTDNSWSPARRIRPVPQN